MKSPNKKFCPYPGCGSFIERSPEEGKYVQCENGHKSCYVCLKKWHGKSQCEEELEKDFQIWKVGKVIKRCPQCHFYTEKNKGCNHMTCPECQYQWCWLCEGKYSSKHFEKGQCSGKQFIQADSLQQVREIEIERRNQRGGNYCCSCCCIDMCAYTNWDCSLICHYIGLIFIL